MREHPDYKYRPRRKPRGSIAPALSNANQSTNNHSRGVVLNGDSAGVRKHSHFNAHPAIEHPMMCVLPHFNDQQQQQGLLMQGLMNGFIDGKFPTMPFSFNSNPLALPAITSLIPTPVVSGAPTLSESMKSLSQCGMMNPGNAFRASPMNAMAMVLGAHPSIPSMAGACVDDHMQMHVQPEKIPLDQIQLHIQRNLLAAFNKQLVALSSSPTINSTGM